MEFQNFCQCNEARSHLLRVKPSIEIILTNQGNSTTFFLTCQFKNLKIFLSFFSISEEKNVTCIQKEKQETQLYFVCLFCRSPISMTFKK